MYNKQASFLTGGEVTWQNENVAELDACAAILVFNLIQAEGEYDQENLFDLLLPKTPCRQGAY